MRKTSRKRLSEYLLAEGAVSSEQLAIALRIQEVTGARLADIIVQQNFCTQAQAISVMMKHCPDELAGSSITNITLPKLFLTSTRTIDQGNNGDTFFIATLHADPDWVVSAATKMLSEQTGREITVKIQEANIRDIRSQLAEYEAESAQTLSKRIEDETDPNIILDRLIDEAIQKRTSDIHIIHTIDTTNIAYRIDGMLRISHVMSKKDTESLFARIKTIMGGDASNTRVPQDGNFTLIRERKRIDFRVSSTPCNNGEVLVIRILNPDNVKRIEDLGISLVGEIAEVANKPKGIFLVCGSTGQGKTTTMYSFLQNMDCIHKKIATIEDPIEYRIPNIVQTQVNRAVGLDFKDFCRNILRQDPDVILVGEIRDLETVESCNHMADTGHSVITSLHCDSVATFFTRMETLGVDLDKLGFYLNGILIQQLVRKLCPKCGKSAKKGCEYCEGEGYLGRIPLVEFAKIDDYRGYMQLRQDIAANNATYYTFEQDARVKIAQGLTDCAEISRHFKKTAQFCNGGARCLDGGAACIR